MGAPIEQSIGPASLRRLLDELNRISAEAAAAERAAALHEGQIRVEYEQRVAVLQEEKRQKEQSLRANDAKRRSLVQAALRLNREGIEAEHERNLTLIEEQTLDLEEKAREEHKFDNFQSRAVLDFEERTMKAEDQRRRQELSERVSVWQTLKQRRDNAAGRASRRGLTLSEDQAVRALPATADGAELLATAAVDLIRVENAARSLWAARGAYLLARILPLARRLYARRHATSSHQFGTSLAKLDAVLDVLAKRFVADKAAVGADLQRSSRRIAARREHDVREASEVFQQKLNLLDRRRDCAIEKLQVNRQRRLDELGRAESAVPLWLNTQLDLRLARVDHELRRGLEEAAAWHGAQRAGSEQTAREGTAREERRFQALQQLRATVKAIRREYGAEVASWDDPACSFRQPTRGPVPVVRIGEFRVDAAPGPQEEQGRPDTRAEASVALPLALRFPSEGNFVLEVSSSSDLPAAANVVGSALLRLAMLLPVGMAQFVLAGESVGMRHLLHALGGDGAAGGTGLGLFDRVVPTDLGPRVLVACLDELCARIDGLMAKLVTEADMSLAEFNAGAGELAETYRVLVLVGLPSSLDNAAISKLTRILGEGPRCGVVTLAVLPPDRSRPPAWRSDRLSKWATMVTFEGRVARLVVGESPSAVAGELILDGTPDTDFVATILRSWRVSEARRILLGFDRVAPPREGWWTASARTGVEAAVGRWVRGGPAVIRVGDDGPRHVAVIGRVGSGKASWLRTFVTASALKYAPDELTFHLMTLRSGVGFRQIAAHGLPHARLIASAAPPAFVSSAVRSILAEANTRAEFLRASGARDLAAYRVGSGQPMPRRLVVIDGVDEATDEALNLLRALTGLDPGLGVHVVVTTDSWANLEARAPGWVDASFIRIFLEPEKGDALPSGAEARGLVRYLDRPGEAVVNEGSSPVPVGENAAGRPLVFQTAWLLADDLGTWLRPLVALGKVLPEPTYVFDGESSPEPARCTPLVGSLDRQSWPATGGPVYLGEPLEIGEPVAAVFRRKPGSHLLVVGGTAEEALGVMAAGVLGLAAAYPPTASNAVRAGARFFVLDGTPDDAPEAGRLADLASGFPHEVMTIEPRYCATALGELDAELKRRRTPGPDGGDGPELILFVHQLQWLDELVRMGGGTSDHFGAILTDGPRCGLHVIASGSVPRRLGRLLSGEALSCFGLQVVFRTGAEDLARLKAPDAAASLSHGHALFLDEDAGQATTFRPFRFPGADWINRVRERLSNRSVTGKMYQVKH
jgi:hypothetical protein